MFRSIRHFWTDLLVLYRRYVFTTSRHPGDALRELSSKVPALRMRGARCLFCSTICYFRVFPFRHRVATFVQYVLRLGVVRLGILARCSFGSALAVCCASDGGCTSFVCGSGGLLRWSTLLFKGAADERPEPFRVILRNYDRSAVSYEGGAYCRLRVEILEIISGYRLTKKCS